MKEEHRSRRRREMKLHSLGCHRRLIGTEQSSFEISVKTSAAAMGVPVKSLLDHPNPTPATDKQFLAAPIKSATDKFALLPELLKVRGVVREHLDSFNYFVNTGIKRIVLANDRIVSELNPRIYIKFLNVDKGEASVTRDTLKVTVEYVEGAHDLTPRRKEGVRICTMPIMLRSCKCHLAGKSESQLARLGECPQDPGGYFLIKGSERVLLIQEQLSKNRIIIDKDKKRNVTASVTSSTEKMKSKTVIEFDKKKKTILLLLNAFDKKVPIMVVMKVMGMQNDQEVVQMLGRDPRYGALLLPSGEECAKVEIYNKEQALMYLEGKLAKKRVKDGTHGRVVSVLADVLLANVAVRRGNFHPKCMYVGVMLRRMMDAVLNKGAVDDTDYVGNKRFELSGQLISLLFEDQFKTMIEAARKELDNNMLPKAKPVRILALLSLIQKSRISEGIERALCTGNFILDRFRMKKSGVTQVLTRLSFIGALGSMTKTKPQVEKSLKVSGPRALQPSQWGMLCPCDTPEGQDIGLVKNLALMALVTTDEEDDPLISLCYALGVEDLEQLSAEELHSQHSFLGISRVKGHHMEELKAGYRTFDDFLNDGLIEYLDVNEQNNALIALYGNQATAETTHIEIEPLGILGVIAGLIPYPHHNQSPRNTYQCAMGKQAMGNIAYNQLRRMDTLLYLLVYPQRPLLTTKTIELVGYDKLGAGQNVIVAVMSYSGYDIEDAIVMNKSSLDCGTRETEVVKQDIVACPADRNGRGMRVLDDDGIALPGEIIAPDDILLNKQVPSTNTAGHRPAPLKYKGPQGESYVLDKVSMYPDTYNNLQCKFLVRHTRRPEVGDKFSSRHGQKGVCGTIVQQEDLPFSERGICPDLIMNPHGFPSRMTVGKMIELLGSKAGVSCGRFHYGSAFGEPSGHADKVETVTETLVNMGFSYDGKDFLYSGLTGCLLQTYIFMGPIYYQRLKHMVIDKMHARGSGDKVHLTRQPTEGKACNGGLRIGEMERDCLVAYGASMLAYEHLMLASDPYDIHDCRECGLLGYYDHKRKSAICTKCGNGDVMATMKLPYACKLLIQELQSMNIVPRLKLTDA
ncbi:hypothetical protein ACLB2K_053201 [Fragaria x ananassa]